MHRAVLSKSLNLGGSPAAITSAVYLIGCLLRFSALPSTLQQQKVKKGRFWQKPRGNSRRGFCAYPSRDLGRIQALAYLGSGLSVAFLFAASRGISDASFFLCGVCCCVIGVLGIMAAFSDAFGPLRSISASIYKVLSILEVLLLELGSALLC